MLSIPYLVPVQKVWCRKVLISISKVSYELYALHWPIINSFTCLLIYYISEHIEFVKAALLSCAITLPVIYLLAILANSYGSKVIIRVVACLNKYLNADTEKEWILMKVYNEWQQNDKYIELLQMLAEC